MNRARQLLGASVLTIFACIACGRGGASKESSSTEGRVDSSKESLINVNLIREGDAPHVIGALNSSHASVFEKLGAHKFSSHSVLEVLDSEGREIDKIENQTQLKIDASGQFVAHTKNHRGYGRDIYFIDGLLYMRPGVGKYHKRLPNGKQEPVDIREQIFSDLGGYFELLAPSVEYSPTGDSTFAGRKAVGLSMSKAPSAKKTRAPETSPHRQWRNTVKVTNVSGSLQMDESAGFPLVVQFQGNATFQRGGLELRLKIEYQHKVERIDESAELAVPTDAGSVSSELEASQVARSREMLDELGAGKRK